MIDFNRPAVTGNEQKYVSELLENSSFFSTRHFSFKCEEWLKRFYGCPFVLLTNSVTHALELTALLMDIKAGDEIIMPSYTIVATANSFVLRDGIPVFVDIRPDTMNINETLIEQAITSKTVAIVIVHCAGAACEMEPASILESPFRILKQKVKKQLLP